MIRRATVSPKPDPSPCPLVVKNGSKIFDRCWAEIPAPESDDGAPVRYYGGYAQRSCPFHRLHRIRQEIREGLSKLVGQRTDAGVSGIVLVHDNVGHIRRGAGRRQRMIQFLLQDDGSLLIGGVSGRDAGEVPDDAGHALPLGDNVAGVGNGLFNSCPMPAVSTPRLPRFSAWMSWSWSWLSSVVSRRIRPMRNPSPDFPGRRKHW
jgi:hypothetical protein